MKKARSAREHAIAVSRVAAAVRLQNHRPQVHDSKKRYDRNQIKRSWQKDQERFSFGPAGQSQTPLPTPLANAMYRPSGDQPLSRASQ